MVTKNETNNNDIKNAPNDSEEKLVEMENNWKRALADYRNLQKRVEEEREKVVKFANYVLVSQLLPILDNLEMLWNHNKDDGIKLIIKGFKEALENSGVEEIEVEEGTEFDPNIMEAVENFEEALPGVSKQGGGKSVVREIIQKGYRMHGKLIRPVQVKIKLYEKGN